MYICGLPMFRLRALENIWIRQDLSRDSAAGFCDRYTCCCVRGVAPTVPCAVRRGGREKRRIGTDYLVVVVVVGKKKTPSHVCGVFPSF